MRTIDIFNNNNFDEKIIKKNISRYLKEFTGFNVNANDVIFKKLTLNYESLLDTKDLYIVILKDDIKRIQKIYGGSGALRQKQWSIFVFNFIDSNNYVTYFGRNENKKDIEPPFNQSEFDTFAYTIQKNNYSGNYPKLLFRSKRIDYLLHNYIFKKMFNDFRFLFLNSFVYSVIGIVDSDSKIVTLLDGYSNFYYNTKHQFKQILQKKVIEQKNDINLTSFMVKDIDQELLLIKSSYSDVRDLVNAYKNELLLNPVTELNYTCIDRDVNSSEKFIITEGMARTGKTVIAMRLLGKYKNSNLIIMNTHFYNSLIEIFKIENEPFPTDRISCHTEFDKTQNMIYNSTILIIDEAQRLNRLEIDSLISNKATNVILGDNLQKCNPNHDKGIQNIELLLKEKNLEYKKYYFDYSIGLANNVLYAIKYMIFNNIAFRNQNINNYEINIFNDADTFEKKYKNDNTFKKHLATIYLSDGKYFTFNDFKRMKPDFIKKYPYYLNKDIKENIMLTTYEMISRELDSIYVYIPNEVIATEGGLTYEPNPNLNDYMLNQIYILMTRAKGCINIYCENKSTYEYLLNRCNKLIKNNSDVCNLLKDEKKKKYELERKINNRGITRLIHFTSKQNLESINEYGIMATNKLKENGIVYDFNDELRLDKIEDGISISIQNPNHFLLQRFKEKYPDKSYVALILDPSLLYQITDASGKHLAKRYYCNYNAASSYTSMSNDNIDLMFEDKFIHSSWINTRIGKDDSETTSNQAEIVFCETIDPKYILDVKEV